MIRSIGTFLLLCFIILFATLGCASNKGTVGETFRHDAAEQTSTNGSPTKIGILTPTGAIEDANGTVIVDKEGRPTVPVESIFTSSTGPGFVSVSSAKETRAVSTNTVIRSFSLTPTPEGRWVLNVTSGTDVKASATADDFKFDPKTYSLTGKNLHATFETLTSTPFRASNESLAAWKEVYLKMTEEQRTVFVAQLEAQKAGGGIAGEFAASLLKYLVAP